MENLDRFRYANYDLRSLDVQRIYCDELNEIYQLYRSTWDQENKELYGLDEATPEAFFLNDTAQCLYEDEQLLAFNLARHANLNTQHHRDQRWLACWPDEVLQQLSAAYGDDVIIGNHLTVKSTQRRTMNAGNIAMIFAKLISCQIVETDALYLGAMRTSRSVQKLGEACGAVTLREGFDVYGVDANLVCFPGKGISDTTDSFPREIKDLYTRIESYGSRDFKKED